MKTIEMKVNNWSKKHPTISFTFSTLLTGLMVVGLLIWGH